MKKIFTKLMALTAIVLLSAGNVNAAIGPVTEAIEEQTYLDVTATANGSGDEVTVAGQYIAYTIAELTGAGVKDVWYTSSASTSNSTDAVTIAGFRSACSRYTNISSTDSHKLYITGCSSISGLYDPRGGSRYITITATDMSDSENTTTTYTNSGTVANNTKYEVSLSGLDASKYYEVVFVTNNSSNSRFYQIKFEASAAVAPDYTITPSSNNDSWGTVSVTGNVITAVPAPGYGYADPAYTVTSGAATVSQNGNLFTVTTEEDCAVTINFAEVVLPPTISSFTIPGITFTKDDVAGTITATVPFGTDVTALVPTIELSGSAPLSCDPLSSVEQDFTYPVTYTVTGVGGVEKVYTVTIVEEEEPIPFNGFWNFSDFAIPATIASGANFDFSNGLTAYGGTSTLTSESTNATLDGYTFTTRLKTTGNSDIAGNMPKRRYLALTVSEPVYIIVYVAKGGDSGNRSLIITDGANELHNLNVATTSVEKQVYHFTQNTTTTLYLCAGGNGLNFYGIGLSATNPDTPNSITDLSTPKAIQSVQYYNALGAQVSLATKGLVLIKTIYEDGAQTTTKVYNTAK